MNWKDEFNKLNYAASTGFSASDDVVREKIEYNIQRSSQTKSDSDIIWKAAKNKEDNVGRPTEWPEHLWHGAEELL